MALTIVGLELAIPKIPPPSGAELPVIVTLVRVGLEVNGITIPPPS